MAFLSLVNGIFAERVRGPRVYLVSELGTAALTDTVRVAIDFMKIFIF